MTTLNIYNLSVPFIYLLISLLVAGPSLKGIASLFGATKKKKGLSSFAEEAIALILRGVKVFGVIAVVIFILIKIDSPDNWWVTSAGFHSIIALFFSGGIAFVALLITTFIAKGSTIQEKTDDTDLLDDDF